MDFANKVNRFLFTIILVILLAVLTAGCGRAVGRAVGRVGSEALQETAEELAKRLTKEAGERLTRELVNLDNIVDAGDVATTLTRLTRLTAEYPNNLEIHLVMAVVELENAQPNRAIQALIDTPIARLQGDTKLFYEALDELNNRLANDGYNWRIEITRLNGSL